MKRLMAMIISLALVSASLIGCGKSSEQADSSSTEIGDTVNFMFWGGFIDETIFDKFEQETGCHVNVSYITNTDELMAKMLAGDHGLDLIHLEHAYVKTFIDAELLQPYDRANVPNMEKITKADVAARGDENYTYTIPDGFDAAFSSVIYNKETCPIEIKSFKDLANPALKGQVIMPESTVTLFGTALNTLGYAPDSTNEKEQEEAYNLLMTIKPNLKAMVGATGVPQLENGEASVALLYGSDWINLMSREENRDKFAIANIEGYEAPISYYAVPAEAEHKAAAEALANYLLSDDSIAATTETCTRIPALGVESVYDKVTDAVKNNPGYTFPDYVKEKSWTQVITPETVELMDKYYTLFKS